MKVSIIKKELTSKGSKIDIKKRNVAAYARVSTNSFEQENSLEVQKNYYKKYIQSHEYWNFVGIYSDEGISGLGTKNRIGFNSLIDDALAGKIDLIITKSISRFARNVIDTLTAIRKLKSNNVEVYFEKESISTFDSNSEFVLSILSSYAQEESRSLSENVKWAKRKEFAKGKYTLAYSHFLGYDKGDKHPLKINKKEAKIVKLIYLLYLEGRTTYNIAKLLTDLSIPSPSGNDKWFFTAIHNILTNEKYKGDALLQKRYTIDYLTRRQVKNNGELNQYYIHNGHPPIIPKDIHEYVQILMQQRRTKAGYSGHSSLSEKIICECGAPYRKRYANSNKKYHYARWVCNEKNKPIKHSPPISDNMLHQFIKMAFVELIDSKIVEIELNLIEICSCIPSKYSEITECINNMSSIDISELMLTDSTLRILIKSISIDESKKATIEFINGLSIVPK